MRYLLALGILLFSGIAMAQNYALVEGQALLNDAYYAGEANEFTPANPNGRFCMFGSISKSGDKVAFWSIGNNFGDIAVFVADIGDDASWRPVYIGGAPNVPIAWTPDDTRLIVGPYLIDVATGALTQPDVGPEGLDFNDASTTSLPENNWAVTRLRDINISGEPQVTLVPILRDGTPDTSREIVSLTQFPTDDASVDWPLISPDGSRILFADFRGGGDGNGVPDYSDVMLLNNVEAIRTAALLPSTHTSSLAPPSLDDPNIVKIRTNEDSVDNFAHVPRFSQDQTLTFWTEDWNNAWSDTNFFGTMALSDFDVMLTTTDNSGSDIRFAQPGNQFITGITPGGVRLLYLSGNGPNLHLMMSSIQTQTPVSGTPAGDNGVETDVPQEANDGSGTQVDLPAGTTIQFPSGAPQEIQILAPIEPADPDSIPSGIETVTVLREFGPEGTTFSPPVPITITYTDDEVGAGEPGFDESSIKVFTYNESTQLFEEVTTIVNRDLANNTITFTVEHFSVYGLGLSSFAATPALRDSLLLLLACLIAACGAMGTLRIARKKTA